MLYVAICTQNAQTNRLLLEQNRKLLTDLEIPHTLDTYTGPDELAGILSKNPQHYHLLFLEVVGGLAAAVLLRETAPGTAIVLIADTPEYAVEGYRVQALRYLLTPIRPDMLADIYDSLRSCYQHRRLTLYTETGLERIRHEDILFLHTKGRTAEIVLTGRVITCSDVLSDLLPRLSSERFIRTHQSYVVNLQHIETLTKTAVFLSGNYEVPVSRRLYAGLREILEHRGRIL